MTVISHQTLRNELAQKLLKLLASLNKQERAYLIPKNRTTFQEYISQMIAFIETLTDSTQKNQYANCLRECIRARMTPCPTTISIFSTSAHNKFNGDFSALLQQLNEISGITPQGGYFLIADYCEERKENEKIISEKFWCEL
jgi:hypothetical protein